MTHHHLKIHPAYFQAKLDGLKDWEHRREEDRVFAVGDDVLFHEWDPETELFTGREIGFVDIVYIFRDGSGACVFTHTMPENLCAKCKELEAKTTARIEELLNLVNRTKHQLASARQEIESLQDELDAPSESEKAEEVLDLGQDLIGKIGRIRDIRSGAILHADLDHELESLFDFVRNRAEVFGVTP